MNPFADTSHPPALRPAADKWSCDLVALASGLLPPLDVLSVLVAGYLSVWIYALWVAPTGLAFGAWSSYEWTALVAGAVLAAVCLYDQQFGTRASRGQVAALIRRYGLGFLIFASATLVVAFASRGLDSLPSEWVALWFGTSLLLTLVARILLAGWIRILERQGVLTEVIAVVGAGPLADRLIRHLRQTRGNRIEILGVFDDTPSITDRGFPRPSGTVADLIELGKTRSIDWIVLALPCTVEDPLHVLVHRLKALAAPIGLCPQNFGLTLPTRAIDYLGDGVPVTLLANRPIRRWSTVVTLIDVLLPQRVCALGRALGARARHLLNEWWATTPTELALDNYDTAAFAAVAARFDRDRYDYVVTPNADHLIRLHEDPSFRALYAAAGYVLLDSRFLSRLLRLTRGIRLPVCTGSDLTAKLFADVLSRNDPLVLIGGTSEQAALLVERYGLRQLAHFNPPMGFIRDPAAVETCLRFVEENSPFRFCLLALGSPQQEIIARSLKTRGIARGLALCVGASIDFLTGAERRAPVQLQRLGLEWLFRLVQEPGRMASRYLVRGPRVFGLLRKTRIVLRPAPNPVVVPIVRAARPRLLISPARIPSAQIAQSALSALSGHSDERQARARVSDDG